MTSKQSYLIVLHSRIRNHYLTGEIQHPTFESVDDPVFEDRAKQAKKKKDGKRKPRLKEAFDIYFPAVRNWEIKKMEEACYGVGIVATEAIKSDSIIQNLLPINGRTKMRGPVAFINHACSEHMNVYSTGKWDECKTCKNIEKDEQLFTDYYGLDEFGKEKEPFLTLLDYEESSKVEDLPCQFCLKEQLKKRKSQEIDEDYNENESSDEDVTAWGKNGKSRKNCKI
jgi:hypothetical protein